MNLPSDWNRASVLITGGTGSFGRAFAQYLLRERCPRRLILYSRDELKQFEMRQELPDGPGSPVRYFIGDVRDPARLARAFDGVDLVIHAAALKQVPTAEYNPLEVIKTNVLGAANVIDAAIDAGVSRVVALSTDKAASPVNLYGASKLCADKLFTSANVYTRHNQTLFAVVRYGNVIGSRGSILPIFLRERHKGVLPITDTRMTRFWITLQAASDLVLSCIERMSGGEVFVPKLPSMRITDLADAVAPGCRHEIVGARPGEKIHEVLLTAEESRRALEFGDYFVVLPHWAGHQVGDREWVAEGTPLPEDFVYSSDTNDRWMTREELLQCIKHAQEEPAAG